MTSRISSPINKIINDTLLLSNYDDATENLENHVDYNIISNQNNKVQIHEEHAEKVSVRFFKVI